MSRPLLFVLAAAFLVTSETAAAAGVRRGQRSAPLSDTQNDILKSLGVAPSPAKISQARSPEAIPAATSGSHAASTGNASSASGIGNMKLDRSSEDLLKALTSGGSTAPQQAPAPKEAAPQAVESPKELEKPQPQPEQKIMHEVAPVAKVTPPPAVVANASASAVTNATSVQAVKNLGVSGASETVDTAGKAQHKVEIAASKLEEAANEAARKLGAATAKDGEAEEAKQKAQLEKDRLQAEAAEAKREAQVAEAEAKRKAEEEAARQKEAAEQVTRRAAEEEAKRKALEEEAARKAAEEGAARKAAEEKAKAEAELRRNAEDLRVKEAKAQQTAAQFKQAKVKEAQEALRRMAEQARADSAEKQQDRIEDGQEQPERPGVIDARRKARSIAEKRAKSEKSERLRGYFANKAQKLREQELKADATVARWEARKSAEEAQARQEAEEEAKRKAEILKKNTEEAAAARASQKHLRNATSDRKMMEQARAHAAKEVHRRKEQDTVVNFLFLVNDGLPHADVWNSFFAEAPPHQVKSFVHCRDRQGCRSSGLLTKIPQMQLVETVPTYYCHDLVTAMVELLRSSLKTTTSKRAKFVFISDSTLPLKPFPEVYSGLDETDDSDICVLPSHHWGTMDMHSSARAQTSYLVKHSQWVVLNKEHATKMVREWKPVDAGGHWEVPIAKREENHLVPSTTDVATFVRKSYANTCTDEWAFFATIFGAIPDIDESKGETSVAVPGWAGHNLMMRGAAINKVQGQCRTFAYWDDWGQDFNDLAKLLASDYPHTELSCYPNCGLHPMTMNKISDPALLAMRKSPFMFGRKFNLAPGQAVVNAFNTIALAQTPPTTLATPDVRNLNSAGSLRTDVASHDFLSDSDPPVRPAPRRRPAMDDVYQDSEMDAKNKKDNKGTWWSWMWGK